MLFSDRYIRIYLDKGTQIEMSTLGSHLEWLYNPNERQRRKLPGGAGCHGKANRRKGNFDLDLIRYE